MEAKWPHSESSLVLSSLLVDKEFLESWTLDSPTVDRNLGVCHATLWETSTTLETV